MSPLICLFGAVTLFAYGGQCELAWDKVYGLLSARIDKIIFEQDIIKHEQDVMKKHMENIITSIYATNQQFNEVASFNQKLTSVQERLENMDSHLKEVASAEAERRSHLLRRGLEQEKAATQSRLNALLKIQGTVQSDMNVLMNASDDFRGQMSELKENLKSTMNQAAKLISSTEDKMNTHLNETRVHISHLEKDMDSSIRRIETMENAQSDIKAVANETRAHIMTVEHKVETVQTNARSLQSWIQSLEGTQADIKSKTRAIESQVERTRGQIVGRIETLDKTHLDIKEKANKTQAHIMTVEQKVATVQTNARSLQSRVQCLEEMQADLNSTTMAIESQVDTIRGQVVGRIENLEKTQSDIKGKANKIQAQIVTVEQKETAMQNDISTIQSWVQSLEETQTDLNSKTRVVKSQVDTTQEQISLLKSQVDTTQEQISLLKHGLERLCRKQYGIGSNHGQGIHYTCDDGGDQCQCMQSHCLKPVNQELYEMALNITMEKNALKREDLTKPVDFLMDYACNNFEKATFAVKVTVKEVNFKTKRDVKSALAVIVEAPLQVDTFNIGNQQMIKGDDVEFEWHVTCTQPELTVGRSYFIIAEDESTLNYDQEKPRVRHELTATALVIDPEFKPLVRIVMNNFVKELSLRKGCKA